MDIPAHRQVVDVHYRPTEAPNLVLYWITLQLSNMLLKIITVKASIVNNYLTKASVEKFSLSCIVIK